MKHPERRVPSVYFIMDAHKTDNLINPAQIHNWSQEALDPDPGVSIAKQNNDHSFSACSRIQPHASSLYTTNQNAKAMRFRS